MISVLYDKYDLILKWYSLYLLFVNLLYKKYFSTNNRPLFKNILFKITTSFQYIFVPSSDCGPFFRKIKVLVKYNFYIKHISYIIKMIKAKWK